jgi:hypothetical protein
MFFTRINAAVKLSAEQEKSQENEIDKKEKKDFLKKTLLKAAKKAEREARHLRVRCLSLSSCSHNSL